jgi:transposase
MDAMLDASAALWKQHVRLHNLVFKLVASHKLCCRLMKIPAVGPVAALNFMTAVDDPSRFNSNARDVAA